MANKKQSPRARSAERYYEIALEQQEMEVPSFTRSVPAGPAAPPSESETPSGTIDIRAELARRERIKNDDAEQDIVLKRSTLQRLFRLLSLETAAIFVLAILQAIHEPWHFHLEDWSFKLLTSVTIVQITAMVFVAVRYLFPKSGPGGRKQ